jgi:hypothetical protein
MLITERIKSFTILVKSVNWTMKFKSIKKIIKDFLCKHNIHSYETIKTESGLRIIKQYCKCKNCKKETIFNHDI